MTWVGPVPPEQQPRLTARARTSDATGAGFGVTPIWTIELHRHGDGCGIPMHGPESCFPYALIHHGQIVWWFGNVKDARKHMAGVEDE